MPGAREPGSATASGENLGEVLASVVTAPTVVPGVSSVVTVRSYELATSSWRQGPGAHQGVHGGDRRQTGHVASVRIACRVPPKCSMEEWKAREAVCRS